jgi:RNA polymerase sigma factor (sigma-70 family)
MEEVFINLINNHRGIIFKVCNLYCRDKEDQKDLFQEVTLQLWKSLPSFRNESLMTTWMYRVALNTAISHFRKESRKPDREGIAVADLQIPDLSGMAEENDKLALLKEAIQQLTKVEKAIIMLYLEEKSYAEISEIMGITHSNVGVKLNRIKIKLEKIIQSTHHELR